MAIVSTLTKLSKGLKMQAKAIYELMIIIKDTNVACLQLFATNLLEFFASMTLATAAQASVVQPDNWSTTYRELYLNVYEVNIKMLPLVINNWQRDTICRRESMKPVQEINTRVV